MERIFDTLPQAKKWTFVLFIISAIVLLFGIASLIFGQDFSGILSLIMQGFLTYFLFAYYRACGAGIEDESEESLEEACRQQKNIFVMYGIRAVFLLITFFLIAISLVMMAAIR